MKKTAIALFIILLVFPVIAQEQRFTVPLEGSPSLGPENAPVTIVEFVDFQ